MLERLGEIELAAHRRVGDRRDRSFRPCPGRQHLDRFALHQSGIDVEHDEPFGAPRQAEPLDRHVDPLVGGNLSQDGPQPAIGSRRHRDPQFQSGDRIVGDAANEVDVDAQGRHLPGHRAECASRDRAPQHIDGVGRWLPDDRQVVAALDAHVQTQRPDRGLHVAPQRGAVGDFQRTGHQHPERQAPPDHHLFDVEQLDAMARQHLEEC